MGGGSCEKKTGQVDDIDMISLEMQPGHEKDIISKRAMLHVRTHDMVPRVLQWTVSRKHGGGARAHCKIGSGQPLVRPRPSIEGAGPSGFNLSSQLLEGLRRIAGCSHARRRDRSRGTRGAWGMVQTRVGRGAHLCQGERRADVPSFICSIPSAGYI